MATTSGSARRGERRAGALGVAHDTALRAALIVEELFVNSVRHGQAPTTGTIRVDLRVAAGDELELAFEDPASPSIRSRGCRTPRIGVRRKIVPWADWAWR